MPALTGSSSALQISPDSAQYTLQAPGLVGQVKEIQPAPGETRADYGLYEEALAQAIAGADIFAGKVFEIQVTEDRLPAVDAATRADGLTAVTRLDEPALVLNAPRLGAQVGYAVLYTDEGGVSRVILPEAAPETEANVRFHIPRASAPSEVSPLDEQTRGPISKLGRKVVRMLAWKTSELLSKPINDFARDWEAGTESKPAKHPYQFLTFTAEGYDPQVDWGQMQSGRALLLLHGTFSTAQGAFLFPKPVRELLVQLYQGRVFAFNHPSVYHSPVDNIQELFNRLPDGANLKVDILTHSRGGLVGRTLMELQDQLDTHGKQVEVQRAVLVASPNQGTILADPEYMLELVDRYTNIITNLPDNVYTLTLESLLVLVKLLGHAALTQLPGLNCLPPGSPLIKQLAPRQNKLVDYFAVTSDYAPETAAMIKRFRGPVADKLIDLVFKAKNDMVVPTEGSYTSPGDPPTLKLPQGQRVVYSKGVHHGNYFDTPRVAERIAELFAQGLQG